jgi:rhamnose utilization protein RhaD (predicted bifunctional aldolase and dehydrogenase)
VLVPYADPGVPLARAIRDRLAEFAATHDDRPRLMYMKNHGLTVFGVSARQVQDSTAMAMKAARILVGTYALGGPEFMDDVDVRRIHVRDDEHYRQRVLEGR